MLLPTGQLIGVGLQGHGLLVNGVEIIRCGASGMIWIFTLPGVGQVGVGEKKQLIFTYECLREYISLRKHT